MLSNIFDTHAHYDDEAFDNDRFELLSSLEEKGVCGVINCGCSIESSKMSLRLSEKYPFVFAACGVHPQDAATANGDWLVQIELLLSHKKAVAVGEIGLDYHYDTCPREKQLEVFENQLILANRLSLPVIVHDREAHADTLSLLKKHRPRGVMHCFSGSVESAKEVVSLGMLIGLGGSVTFKNAKTPPEVAAFVPRESLLLETDCPYMTPVPFRGKRNDSSLISLIAEKIAEVRGEDAAEVLDYTKDNARKLFGI